jgi:microcystin-dependent protein
MTQAGATHSSRILCAFGVAVMLTTLFSSVHAQATDPFIGQLALVPYNFAPKGWAFCNGQLLPINQNAALFSLLGTTYGGDGVTTFALPDLRGRVPISSGQGPGLSSYNIGQMGGYETHTLTINEMPAHSHTLYADTSVGTTEKPGSALPARNGAGVPQYGTAATTQLSSAAAQPTGGGAPHDIRQPYVTLNWIIALTGVYPSRN